MSQNRTLTQGLGWLAQVSRKTAISPRSFATISRPSISASSSPIPRPHMTPTQNRPNLSTVASRAFSTTPRRRHGAIDPPNPGEELWVTFIDRDGVNHKFGVCEGDNLLDIAQHNDLELEGACGGSCACSTCHVIVEDQALYDKMPELDDDEADMLDLAFGLQETSRLGCQIKMTKELDGLVVKLPQATRNLQARDFETASTA